MRSRGWFFDPDSFWTVVGFFAGIALGSCSVLYVAGALGDRTWMGLVLTVPITAVCLVWAVAGALWVCVGWKRARYRLRTGQWPPTSKEEQR